jgi:hypothetical protein
MKPTVFLSHSSRDQAVLGEFKRILEQKTGRAIQMFLSSDGQSIPLGRNWVHRIQQALDETAMMLVLLSPASITSQWIHFEAGYAFSKGLRVVPIAFAGFDLAHLTPPLSLLQGFNLRGADGLNNVIALINQQFDLSFQEDFTDADYIAVFGGGLTNPLGVMAYVEEITLAIEGDTQELLRVASEALASAGIEYSEELKQNRLRTFGAVFSSPQHRRLLPSIDVQVDPTLFELARPAIDAMLSIHTGKATLQIMFDDRVQRVQEFHKVSALLYGTGINIRPHETYAAGEITFHLTGRRFDDDPNESPIVEFRLSGKSVGSVPFETAELLWRRGALSLL